MPKQPKQEADVPAPDRGVEIADPPSNVSVAAGQARLIAQEVVRALESKVAEHRHSDFVFMISVFGVGFIALAGMLIVGYFRLDDRISGLSEKMTRTETKLEDLLARIPPIPTPPRPGIR
jgi:hypothetical protein